MKEHNDTGLFQHFTRRMSAARKKAILRAFFKDGRHISPSGLTARIVTDFCVENELEFTLTFRVQFGKCYAIIIDNEISKRGLELL